MQGENKNIYDDDGMSLNTRQVPYVPDNNKAPYNGNADMTVPQKSQPLVNNDKDDSEKAGLFDGISKAQVLAGALASVTSMLLSSKIGIAGSVIGVAVGSVVSTVASTVYKNILNNSANALKNASMFGGNDHDGSNAEQTRIAGYNDTTLDQTVIDTPLKSYLDSQGKTSTASTSIGIENGNNENGSTLRVAPDELIEKNAERHKKQLRNRMIIFSVVASLIAVAITAILINAFTGGEGIGQKTDPIILPPSSVSSNKTDSADADKTDSVTTPSKKQQDTDSDSDDKFSNKKSIDEHSKDASGYVDSDSSSSTTGKVNGTDSASSSDKSSTGQSDSSSSITGNSNTNNSSSNSNANSSKSSSDSNSAGSGNQAGSNTQQPSTPSQDSGTSSDSSSSATSGNGTTNE